MTEPNKNNYLPDIESPPEEYDSIHEVIEKIYMNHRRSSDRHRQLDPAYAILSADDYSAIDEMKTTLHSMGFRKFAPIQTDSQNSIALQTTKDQIIRLSAFEPSWVTREEYPENLPNITEKDFGEIRTEIMPTVAFRNFQSLMIATNKSYQQLLDNAIHYYGAVEGLAHQSTGLTTGEIQKDTAFTLSGRACVVDRETTHDKYTGDEKREFNPETDSHWVVPATVDMPESRFAYLKGTGYISIYEHDYPAVHDQRPRGVLSDADIDLLWDAETKQPKRAGLIQLKTEKPECFKDANGSDVVSPEKLGAFVQLVQGEGWYPSQAIEIMAERDKATGIGAAGGRQPN